MATKNKMELVIGVSVGSSIQIAAGMIPLLVLIAWPLNKDLTLFFANFETIVLFVAVLLVNLLLQDGAYLIIDPPPNLTSSTGRSNYMEGMMRESGPRHMTLTASPLSIHGYCLVVYRIVGAENGYDSKALRSDVRFRKVVYDMMKCKKVWRGNILLVRVHDALAEDLVRRRPPLHRDELNEAHSSLPERGKGFHLIQKDVLRECEEGLRNVDIGVFTLCFLHTSVSRPSVRTLTNSLTSTPLRRV